MKDTLWQARPSPVVGREPEPQQDGEVRDRWLWVEASVWTTRMLKALETGMEGAKHLLPRAGAAILGAAS